MLRRNCKNFFCFSGVSMFCTRIYRKIQPLFLQHCIILLHNAFDICMSLRYNDPIIFLGVFFAWFWGMLAGKPILRYSLPPICGIAVAAIDETIQIFSPGRYCSIKDVAIDSSGVITGVLVLCVAVYLFHKCKKDAQ